MQEVKKDNIRIQEHIYGYIYTPAHLYAVFMLTHLPKARDK